MPLGGVLSGFFGGLSGHQGALRSMFLVKCGLDATSFVATGVVIAIAIDLTRLALYGGNQATLLANAPEGLLMLVLVACGDDGRDERRYLDPLLPLVADDRSVTDALLEGWSPEQPGALASLMARCEF
mgnify:CR=1 FL=1